MVNFQYFYIHVHLLQGQDNFYVKFHLSLNHTIFV